MSFPSGEKVQSMKGETNLSPMVDIHSPVSKHHKRSAPSRVVKASFLSGDNRNPFWEILSSLGNPRLLR